MNALARILSAAFAILACVNQLASAQPYNESAGRRLIAESGAPQRFTLRAEEMSLKIVDGASGLECSIPVNAPDATLTASDRLMQCGYSGSVSVNWMVVPSASSAGQMDLQRFVAAYALFQQEQTPTLQVQAPPNLLPTEIRRLFPNAPQPFAVWMRDSRDGADYLVSLMAADVNGHRLMLMVAGPADPVTALSELSFITSMPSAAPGAAHAPASPELPSSPK